MGDLSPRNLQELRRLRQEVGDPSRRFRGTMGFHHETGEKWWFQHVSTMVFHGDMMVLTVLTMVLTRFHGGFMVIDNLT